MRFLLLSMLLFSVAVTMFSGCTYRSCESGYSKCHKDQSCTINRPKCYRY